jgi:DNA-binding CsgD family transcriptional regulator
MGELDDEIARKKKLLELVLKGYELSRRELQVLVCLATNHTDKETGELLHISEHTVATHHRNIFKKLGVHKKFELYPIAKAMGLI